MKQIFSVLLTSALVLALAACGQAEENTRGGTSPVLIVYFFRVGNTDFPEKVDASSLASIVVQDGRLMGNIGVMAEYISARTGGDLLLIETAEKYPVSYDETLDLAADQLGEGYRPSLVNAVNLPEQYDIVFLGYPNWWGDLPVAVYSFLEQCDLSGRTVIPFVSSASSGFSGTQRTLAALLRESRVLDGLHIAGSNIPGSMDAIDA